MDQLTLVAIVLGVIVVVITIITLRRSWGGSLADPARPPSAIQPSVPPVQIAAPSLAEVSALLASGHKIEAIKRYRELTGVGLKQAKDSVEAIAAGSAPPVLPSASTAMPASEGSLAEVHSLALQGKKIEAIKRYRELTGVGLKEAKDYVDALDAGAQPPAVTPVAPSVGDLAEVYALAHQGKKIEAIKRYRELTGVGLKEAKDYVDRL